MRKIVQLVILPCEILSLIIRLILFFSLQATINQIGLSILIKNIFCIWKGINILFLFQYKINPNPKKIVIWKFSFKKPVFLINYIYFIFTVLTFCLFQTFYDYYLNYLKKIVFAFMDISLVSIFIVFSVILVIFNRIKVKQKVRGSIR